MVSAEMICSSLTISFHSMTHIFITGNQGGLLNEAHGASVNELILNCIVVSSSSHHLFCALPIRDGGEYGFEANSEEEERERKRRTAELYSDRVPRNSRGRDGRDALDQRQNFRGEVDRRPVVRQSRDRDATSSNADGNTNKEEDFFDSLMSQLSNDLRDDTTTANDSRVRGSRRHDNAGPNTAKAVESTSGAEDSFFENLMAELGGGLDKSESYQSRSNKSTSQVDDDDFFSSLEAELSQSLGGVFQSDVEAGRDDDVDDFFANLESEISKVGEMSSSSGSDVSQRDDLFTSSDVNDADDFFSSLIDDLAQEMSNEDTGPELMTSTEKTAIVSRSTNLSSFTVPELKDLLRSKGLKVGGTKAELIDRLQSAS